MENFPEYVWSMVDEIESKFALLRHWREGYKYAVEKQTYSTEHMLYRMERDQVSAWMEGYNTGRKITDLEGMET